MADMYEDEEFLQENGGLCEEEFLPQEAERIQSLEDAMCKIQELEEVHLNIERERDDELNKLRLWYADLEGKWMEEKERAEKEAANIQLVNQEKQHLQQQINELQSAAGNMASTAESVHKWLEERTRTARRECREQKTRADQAAASVDALTVEKQELVQQLNELHSAADNMVTTAAESVHQLVEERTRETLQEAQQEKARAEEEAHKAEELEQEKQELLEKLERLEALQHEAIEEAAEAKMRAAEAEANVRACSNQAPPQVAPKIKEKSLPSAPIYVPSVTINEFAPAMDAAESLQSSVDVDSATQPELVETPVWTKRELMSVPLGDTASSQQTTWVGSATTAFTLAHPTETVLSNQQVPNSSSGSSAACPTFVSGTVVQKPMTVSRIMNAATTHGVSLATPTMTQRPVASSPRPVPESRVVRTQSPSGGGQMQIPAGSPRQSVGSEFGNSRGSPRARYVSAQMPSSTPVGVSEYRWVNPMRSTSEPASRMRSIERQTSKARGSSREVARERSPRISLAPVEQGMVRVSTLETLANSSGDVSTTLTATGSAPMLAVGTPSGVSRTMVGPAALSNYQLLRGGVPVNTQAQQIFSAVPSAGSRGGSLNVSAAAAGSLAGSTRASPAGSRSSSVQRSETLPVSMFTSPSSSMCSSRNNSLVPPRKRSEPPTAAKQQLPRLTSGVPWQPSEDYDSGVVIATLANASNVTRAPIRYADVLSASAKSHDTEASGITCIDFSNLCDGADLDLAAFYQGSEPPSQRISLKSSQDGYVLTRGGVGAASASQPIMSQMSPGGMVTRIIEGSGHAMPTTPRVSSVPLKTLGSSPMLSARGRQQSVSRIAVPQWRGESPGPALGGSPPVAAPSSVQTVAVPVSTEAFMPMQVPSVEMTSLADDRMMPQSLQNYMATQMNGKLSGSLTLPMPRGGVKPAAATVRGGSLQCPRFDKSVVEVQAKSGSTAQASRLQSTPRVSQRQTTPLDAFAQPPMPQNTQVVTQRAASPQPPLRASSPQPPTRPASPPPPPSRRGQSPHIYTRSRRVEPVLAQLPEGIWMPPEQGMMSPPDHGIRLPPDSKLPMGGAGVPAWMMAGSLNVNAGSLRAQPRADGATPVRRSQPRLSEVVTTPVRGGTPARVSTPVRGGPPALQRASTPQLGMGRTTEYPGIASIGMSMAPQRSSAALMSYKNQFTPTW